MYALPKRILPAFDSQLAKSGRRVKEADMERPGEGEALSQY